MSKMDDYRAALRSLSDWEPYLLAHSGLPGPRGNLELAHVVAEEASDAQLARWRALTPQQAPVNSPEEFLVFCGVLGLGRRTGGREGGETPPLRELRAFAGDPRWRTREAVAMALQRWGDADMDGLLAEMQSWAADDPLVQRAAMAALCEPRLLRDPSHAAAVLRILDDITSRLIRTAPAMRKTDAFRTLRQALGYGWSVAVVARPEIGKPLMKKWLAHPDPDAGWVMRENLKKNRLVRMDPAWVNELVART
jgi:hypothetical protein